MLTKEVNHDIDIVEIGDRDLAGANKAKRRREKVEMTLLLMVMVQISSYSIVENSL